MSANYCPVCWQNPCVCTIGATLPDSWGRVHTAEQPLARPRPAGRAHRSRGDQLRLNDWFCGAGGATQGAAAIPGVVPVLAANHDALAIATHSTNFPDVEHFKGDICDLDVATHPYAEIFWASPECTNWSQAKGRPVDFDAQPGWFGDPEIADDVARSRALMQDVIRYLEGMVLRQQPVLAGIVENVVDIRKWEHWALWRGRIERLGYRTRLIALNSMHAQSVLTPRAPQSRDRLYLAYWHESLRRDPDWDRWLRPIAHCPSCDQEVAAIQVWRRPGVDMGRFGQQYDYRCPKVGCRGQKVEPRFVPAAAAIDWSLPGQRIGDRVKPLADKTRARIAAGARRYARPIVVEAGGNQYDSTDPHHPQYGNPDAYVRAWPADSEPLKTLHTALTKAVAIPPMLVPAGGTWNDAAQAVDQPMRTRTTRETEALLIPPMLVPVEGRDGKRAQAVECPMRAQTARNETGVLIPPYVTELHGGGSIAQTASGVQSVLRMQDAAVDLTAAEWEQVVDDCLFRMLEPHEIHAGMAFTPDYVVLGSKRQRVKQLGNAVTPPAAEVLVAALVECITGHPLDLEAGAA